MNWIDDLLAKLDGATGGVLSANIGGQTVQTFIGAEFVLFFKTNAPLLQRIGKETFAAFLILIHEKRDEQAFQLIAAKMTADEIIQRLTLNAGQLAQVLTDNEQFKAALEKWVIAALTAGATRILVMYLTGGAI